MRSPYCETKGMLSGLRQVISGGGEEDEARPRYSAVPRENTTGRVLSGIRKIVLLESGATSDMVLTKDKVPADLRRPFFDGGDSRRAEKIKIDEGNPSV